MVGTDIMLLPSVGLFTGFSLIAMTLSSSVQAAETAMVQEIDPPWQLVVHRFPTGESESKGY
ncbi:hypothetical protein [Prochlorococcus sp. MIT 1342]